MKKITPLIASMAILMVASLVVGAGTMAYFSNSAIVNPSLASGTADIQINVNGGGWTNGPVAVSTPVGWAPGDADFTLTIRVKNVGNSGLLIGGMGGSNPSGNLGLADVIEITTLDATEYSDTDYMGAPVSYWDTVFGNSDGTLTVTEYVTSPYRALFWEGTAGPGDPPDTDYLDGGGGDVKEMKITFHFDEDAGNSYQGLTYTFDLTITGTDDPTILGSG